MSAIQFGPPKRPHSDDDDSDSDSEVREKVLVADVFEGILMETDDMYAAWGDVAANEICYMDCVFKKSFGQFRRNQSVPRRS